jgi:hypothetical protein
LEGYYCRPTHLNIKIRWENARFQGHDVVVSLCKYVCDVCERVRRKREKETERERRDVREKHEILESRET